MHEMGIAMEIVKIAIDSIPSDMENSRVEKIHLKVGKLSSVLPDSLRFCFKIISEDTPLDGARLIIEEIPVVAVCSDCNNRWTISEPVFQCKNCNSGSIQIISGRELDIDSIEIAEEREEDVG
jgi:hydrogenase nickel incorporation protein HypA/HybF